MYDDYEPDFGSDDEIDWPDNDANDKKNEASHDAQNLSQISDTNHNPPPTRYWTHQNEEAKSQWYMPV